MQVKAISQLTPFTGAKTVKTEKKVQTAQTNPLEKAPMPSAETLQAMVGVKPQKGGLKGGKPTPEAFSSYEASQLIAESGAFLSKRDYKNVKKVLARGDEQTSNVMMQLELIKNGDIEPSTLSCYWETGKMNDNLAKDLDMVYEARKSGKM